LIVGRDSQRFGRCTCKNDTFGLEERSTDSNSHAAAGSQRYSWWSILGDMKMATGKVVGGKVVLEGVSIKDGASVTVLIRDSSGVDMTAEQEAELLLSIAEADRDETVSADEVLAKLGRRRSQ